jgi:methionyl-tRNA synthetase
MVRTFEIQKKGDGYSIAEQAGSDPHRTAVALEAKSEGGSPDLVDQILKDAASGERVFFEAAGSSYATFQEFPSK